MIFHAWHKRTANYYTASITPYINPIFSLISSSSSVPSHHDLMWININTFCVRLKEMQKKIIMFNLKECNDVKSGILNCNLLKEKKWSEMIINKVSFVWVVVSFKAWNATPKDVSRDVYQLTFCESLNQLISCVKRRQGLSSVLC